ncbi:MAG: hypothetical protein RLZZ597_2188, partial [Cyanobacteriota bacterium]
MGECSDFCVSLDCQRLKRSGNRIAKCESAA